MSAGRGVDPKREMEEGVSEGESPNRKEGLVLQKRSAEEKGRGDLSKNCLKSDLKRGRARKNGLRRAKNERDLSKNRPKSGSKRG